MGEDVVPSFEAKYKVKVTYDFFDNYDTMYAKIGQNGGGYDLTFPTSVDIPALLERSLIQPLDLSLIPNLVNLAAEWANPGYDPGNAHSIPYMWWTTGVAYDTARIKEQLTSWTALWDARFDKHIAMLDDSARGVRGGALPLGQGPEHDRRRRARRGAGPAQAAEAARPDLHDGRHRGALVGRRLDRPRLGLGRVPGQSERDTVVFYIPEEGGVRGSDTAVLLANAKHPIAAHLFINHLLDAQVSASNTNYIGYMGPNAAAKQFIDPAILSDPTGQPGPGGDRQAARAARPGRRLDKYATRWTELKAGA